MVPDARLIEVLWKERGDRYHARSSTPVLLHLSYEAREFALRIYHEVKVENGCGTLEPSDNYEEQIPFGAYVNFQRDQLYFSFESFNVQSSYVERMEDFLAKLEPLDAVSRIQHLAFDAAVMFHTTRYPAKFVDLASLQNISMVVSDPNLAFAAGDWRNTTPDSGEAKIVARNSRRSWIYRWSQRRGMVIGLSYIGGYIDHETTVVQGNKRVMRILGMDKKMVDGLHICAVDIKRAKEGHEVV